jgi:hypothetical protein
MIYVVIGLYTLRDVLVTQHEIYTYCFVCFVDVIYIHNVFLEPIAFALRSES